MQISSWFGLVLGLDHNTSSQYVDGIIKFHPGVPLCWTQGSTEFQAKIRLWF